MLNLYAFYGDDFKVECPTRSGQQMTLFEVAQEIPRRLAATFLRDEGGRRPVYGEPTKFQKDPHWRDLILFAPAAHAQNLDEVFRKASPAVVVVRAKGRDVNASGVIASPRPVPAF